MRRIAVIAALVLLWLTTAAAQGISDRDYLSAIIAERDKQYGQRFDAQEKAVSAALAAAKEAVSKAEGAAEKRFESVNEFRNTLKDQQSGLATRLEVDARFKAMEDKIVALSLTQSQMTASNEGALKLWGLIAGGVGLLGVIGMLVMGAINLRAKARSSR